MNPGEIGGLHPQEGACYGFKGPNEGTDPERNSPRVIHRMQISLK